MNRTQNYSEKYLFAFGYTLTEVLIVLLVLGVIATFVIPAVLKTAPDRPSMIYKKTFYSMQDASKKLISNDEMYPPNDDGVALYSDNTDFCENLASIMNITDDKNCKNRGSSDNPNFTTTNGVKWWGVGGNDWQPNGDNPRYKDIGVNCSGIQYKIRVYEDGKVGTGTGNASACTNDVSRDDWNCETKILSQPFRFRDAQ